MKTFPVTRIASLLVLALTLMVFSQLQAQEPTAPDDQKPPPPPPNKAEEKKGRRPRHRMSPDMFKHGFFKSLLTQEERERLTKLYAEDPEKFRQEIRKKVDAYRAKKQQEEKQIKELAEKVRDAKTPAEKAELAKQLHALVKKQFDERMKRNLEGIESLELRLKELKDEYEKRKENAEKIINDRVKELSEDPALKW